MDAITKAIQEAVEKHAKEQLESVIQRAKEEFEERLRREIGAVVLSLHKFYTVHREEENLVIRVENKR